MIVSESAFFFDFTPMNQIKWQFFDSLVFCDRIKEVVTITTVMAAILMKMN